MKEMVLLLVLTNIAFATYVREGTRVEIGGYSMAILKDSTFVNQISSQGKVIIELDGFIRIDELKNNKVKWERRMVSDGEGTGPIKSERFLRLDDTVELFADTLFQKNIGKAWPSPRDDGFFILIRQPPFPGDSRPHSFLTFHFDGHTDSSSIIEFQPWLMRIKELFSKNLLLGCPEHVIDSVLTKEGKKNKIETKGGVSYLRVTDESRRNSKTDALLFIENAKVCAVWSVVKHGDNFSLVKSGYLYHAYDSKIKLSIIKKTVVKILNFQE